MGRLSFKRLPSPGLTVGVIALIAALSGTAIALPGKNTVDSGDLKRGAVKTSDIARGAVTNSKVRNRTLTRAKVRANTLTGAQIDESTLGEVPQASRANSAATAENATRLGGVPASGYLTTSADTVGRSGFSAACDPVSATFVVCATTSIDLARTSRLLVVANAPFGVDTAPASGNCRIELDGAAVPNTTARTGLDVASSGGDEANVGFGITTVTGSTAAGTHTVSIACNEDTGDIDHNDGTISTVSLGAG